MAFTPQTFPAEGFNGATAEQQQIWWEELSDATAANEAAQNQAIADLQQLTTDLAAVVADQAAIQADLSSTLLAVRIGLSWTSPEDILSATDDGASATISVILHTRRYGDGTSVTIQPTSLTNCTSATEWHLYYNDSSTSDTTPNIQKTTNPDTAANNKTPGRHYLGSITTPAAGGGGSTTGTGPKPPGYTGIGSIP